MKDYEKVKVPMTCSVPFGLLKAFDEIVRAKKSTRSGMIVQLRQIIVNKEKSDK